MPRTKRVLKPNVKYAEYGDENEKKSIHKKNFVQFEDTLKQWNKAEDEVLFKFTDGVNTIEQRFNIAKLKISPSVGNMPPTDKPAPVKATPVQATSKRGMELAIPKAQPGRKEKAMSTSKRVTRSSSCGGEDSDSLNQLVPLRSAMDRFRTPNCNLAMSGMRYNQITPKVMSNVPLSIIRRPREGEMVFALSGSPVLVSNIGSADTANVIVPLLDGRVMSILPEAGLQLGDMPDINSETMRQLKRLHDNLGALFK